MASFRNTRSLLLWLLTLAAVPVLPAGLPPQVRSVVQLQVDTIDGIRIAELSGLAWEARTQVLYGLSDRGRLVRFHLEFTADGRLHNVIPLGALSIQDSGTDTRKKATVDAEGLALWYPPSEGNGLPQLLVATEGLPQVLQVNLEGQVQGVMALPSALDDPSRYSAPNTMLEAVTHSQQHGVLVAPEAPLRDEDPALHKVYAHGRSWTFPVHEPGRSRLKAMDMTDDGQLVVLERSRVGKGKGKGKGLVNVLRRIDLEQCAPQQICQVQQLLVLSRPEGADNFEGMAWLGGQRFLLVSDNLGGRHTSTVFMLIDFSQTYRE